LVTNWDEFDPLRLGAVLALELRQCYPTKWEPAGLKRLLADRASYDDILAGRPLGEIMSRWDAEVSEFQRVRSRYLLY
jgi:Protein of unknown function (DUF1343)